MKDLGKKFTGEVYVKDVSQNPGDFPSADDVNTTIPGSSISCNSNNKH